MRDLSVERESALAYAVELHRTRFQRCDSPDVLKTADKFFEWLTAPIFLTVVAGPAVDQTTGKLTGNNPGGDSMAAYKDTAKFMLTVIARDAKQQITDTPSDVTFTSADTSIVAITGPDENGTVWGVCGFPGSTVITGDWPTSPLGDLQGTLAVDVTAGDAASLEVVAGPAVPQ
jgi:hypothetical protein